MVIIVMGVAGSGKSTIGRALATELGWTLVDADDHHSRRNIEKMRAGIGLTDADRAAWLITLHQIIARAIAHREHAVVACSALKQRYRDILRGPLHPVRFVYLKGDRSLLYERLAARLDTGADLLASQMADLEEPTDPLSITLDASQRPEDLLGAIRHAFGV